MFHQPAVLARGPLNAARALACAAALAALAGCGASRLDGVPIGWTGFRDAQPMVLPSDPAQCPDLAGVYRATGEYRAGDKEPRALADLYGFLALSLQLPGLRGDGQPEWRPTPRATVAFEPDPGGWRVRARDGQGGSFGGQLPALDGAQDRQALRDGAQAVMPAAVRRHTGCIQGRLWVSARFDWRQHESEGVLRHVALFRREAGGLLVSVQRESDSIGMLLPWYSNDSAAFQYWFAPAPGADAR